MRVFFAGASGAIGPPVVRELIDRGHHVVAMTSSAAKAPLLADLGAEPVVADALDADALMRAVRAARPDGVVNMLTRIPAKAYRPAHLRATNELRERGVRHLLDAAVLAGAQRFVSESFFGVYGFGPHERPRTEDDPIGHERNRGRAGDHRRDRVVGGPDPRGQRGAADRGRLAALRRLPRSALADHADHGRARAPPPAPRHRRARRGDADHRADRRRARRGRRAGAGARRPGLQRLRRRAGGDGRLPGRARAHRRGCATAPRAVLARPRDGAVRGDVHGPRCACRCPTPASRTSWAGARATRPTARRSRCSRPPTAQPPNRPRRARTLAT